MDFFSPTMYRTVYQIILEDHELLEELMLNLTLLVTLTMLCVLMTFLALSVYAEGIRQHIWGVVTMYLLIGLYFACMLISFFWRIFKKARNDMLTNEELETDSTTGLLPDNGDPTHETNIDDSGISDPQENSDTSLIDLSEIDSIENSIINSEIAQGFSIESSAGIDGFEKDSVPLTEATTS